MERVVCAHVTVTRATEVSAALQQCNRISGFKGVSHILAPHSMSTYEGTWTIGVVSYEWIGLHLGWTMSNGLVGKLVWQLLKNRMDSTTTRQKWDNRE